MTHEEIQIVPSSGKSMSFQGRLIAHATSDRNCTAMGERWFDLRVYQEVGPSFVPVIEFHSTCEGESTVTIAERVDDSHDIENFYFVFEPCEVLPELVLKSMSADDRQRFVQSLLKLYDTQVNRVLLLVKEHATYELPVEPVPVEKKGLLDFFGRM